MSPKQAPRPQSGNSPDAAPVAAYIRQQRSRLRLCSVTLRRISLIFGFRRFRGTDSVKQPPSYSRQVISCGQMTTDNISVPYSQLLTAHHDCLPICALEIILLTYLLPDVWFTCRRRPSLVSVKDSPKMNICFKVKVEIFSLKVHGRSSPGFLGSQPVSLENRW